MRMLADPRGIQRPKLSTTEAAPCSYYLVAQRQASSNDQIDHRKAGEGLGRDLPIGLVQTVIPAQAGIQW